MAEQTAQNNLEEILKEVSEDLIAAFNKPGSCDKYVMSFWRLNFILEDTKNNLIDKSTNRSEYDRALKLFNTLHKEAKNRKNTAGSQLSLMLFLVNVLKKKEEYSVAKQIEQALTKRKLIAFQPAPVPETTQNDDAQCNKIPHSYPCPGTSLRTNDHTPVEDVPYDQPHQSTQGENYRSAIQLNGGLSISKPPYPPNMVTGSSTHPGTISPRIALSEPTPSPIPVIKQFNTSIVIDSVGQQITSTTTHHGQETTVATTSHHGQETAVATTSHHGQETAVANTEEELMILRRKRQSTQIDIGSQLRLILQENHSNMLEFFQQREEERSKTAQLETMAVVRQIQERNDSITSKIETISNKIADEHRSQLLARIGDFERNIEGKFIKIKNEMAESERLTATRIEQSCENTNRLVQQQKLHYLIFFLFGTLVGAGSMGIFCIYYRK